MTRSTFSFAWARPTPICLVLLMCLVCFAGASSAMGAEPQAANLNSAPASITITAVNPSLAAATALGGIAFPTAVTVTGSNFRPGATVKIGTQFALTVSVSPTQIQASAPGQPAGVLDVTVTNADGASATLPKGFSYSTGPVVYGLSPAAGNAGMPTLVTVSGGNLRGDSTITVGGKPAPIQYFFSSNSLQAEVPANADVPAGGKAAGVLLVTNADGQSFTLPDAFTWISQQEPAAATVSCEEEPAGPRG